MLNRSQTPRIRFIHGLFFAAKTSKMMMMRKTCLFDKRIQIGHSANLFPHFLHHRKRRRVAGRANVKLKLDLPNLRIHLSFFSLSLLFNSLLLQTNNVRSKNKATCLFSATSNFRRHLLAHNSAKFNKPPQKIGKFVEKY